MRKSPMKDFPSQAAKILKDWRTNWPEVRGTKGQQFLLIRITEALTTTHQQGRVTGLQEAAELSKEMLHFDLGTGECRCREHRFLRELSRRAAIRGRVGEQES